ncbi:MAG TPA: hypothetical protein VFF75_05385 [Methylophilaceae bacterium]|nr:hypothetical protein [Methylophilaceae bacterium]
MKFRMSLFAALLTGALFPVLPASSATFSPDPIILDDPIQKNLDAPVAPIEKNGYLIVPLAEFQAQARVLSARHYEKDREAALVPVDLALGWKRMSQDEVLSRINIRQDGRFYFWKTNAFPIPRAEIETQSTNMHLIPADGIIEESLKSVQPGEIVVFNGYLVEVQGRDNWRWRSSLTRKDTGDGACELVYVTSFEVRGTQQPKTHYVENK